MRTKTSFAIYLFIIFYFCSLPSDLLAQANQRKSMITLSKLSAEFERLSKSVSPAIVQILATGYVPGVNQVNMLTKQRSSGSGVVLDANGFIITNAHVVEGARRVQVALNVNEMQNGRKGSILKPRGEIVGAQIVGIDRETDLAVLKVDKSNLPFLKLGDSDTVEKGQLVLAFGSPLGLENSVTMGIVSSIARQLRPEDRMIYIQTDAPINPGNSGGPLVDTNGNVIGINTLIFSQSGGSEGIGFAAPSNIVKNVFNQIRSTGRVRRGEIGVSVQTITPLLATGLDLPRVGRVVIADVEPYSPAATAGLRIGDIILSLDRKAMENGRQFDVNLYSRSVGNHVILEIQRGEIDKIIKVEIRERPNDPGRFSDMVSPERNLIPKLGILALDLDETISRMLPPLRVKTGVVVANRANLLYEQDELLPGDVIHFINNQEIHSLEDLKAFVGNLAAFDAVVVQVERRGQFKYISFEME
ncbi:trypsin-like peptidase domain-containing protein [candidate division KSB1 bacterium]|nr:trypsin-like peptidase domain-containing protein [candidate division KSB1 bacterium]